VSDDSILELVRCGRYRKSATRREWLQDFHNAWRERLRHTDTVYLSFVTNNCGVREIAQS